MQGTLSKLEVGNMLKSMWGDDPKRAKLSYVKSSHPAKIVRDSPSGSGVLHPQCSQL